MKQMAKIRPINSLIFISDSNGGEPPMPVRGAQVLATPSCISVICYPEQDGPTEVMLGGIAEVDPNWEPVFDGDLATPSRTIIVSTVTYEKLLQVPVTGTSTRIRVWISHPRWPDKVMIGMN